MTTADVRTGRHGTAAELINAWTYVDSLTAEAFISGNLVNGSSPFDIDGADANNGIAVIDILVDGDWLLNNYDWILNMWIINGCAPKAANARERLVGGLDLTTSNVSASRKTRTES